MNREMNKKIKIACIVFVLNGVILGAFVIAGPFISMLGIQSSLDSDNEESLNCYIDFPELQKNFKASISEQAQESLGFSNNDGMLAQFAMKFTNQIIDIAVENAISPSGLSMLLSGQDLNELMVADRKEKSQNRSIENQEQPVVGVFDKKEAPSVWVKITNSEFEYINHKEFVFYLEEIEDKDSVTQLVFIRKGVWWKLSNVVFSKETESK